MLPAYQPSQTPTTAAKAFNLDTGGGRHRITMGNRSFSSITFIPVCSPVRPPDMKCQNCEKPATFHITELTGPQPQEHHLCETCAKSYLADNDPTTQRMLKEILAVEEEHADDLASLLEGMKA